jgi:hypothetical protein
MTTRQLDRYTLERAAEICDEESRYYGQGAATCARSIRALAASLPQASAVPEGTCVHCGLVLNQAFGGTPPCRAAWGGSPEARPLYPHCVLTAPASGKGE